MEDRYHQLAPKEISLRTAFSLEFQCFFYFESLTLMSAAQVFRMFIKNQREARSWSQIKIIEN